MSRIFRVAVVFVFLAGVVALGMQGNAWASRPGIGSPIPAASAPGQALLLGSRPQGTTVTTPLIAPLPANQPVTIGSCATLLVQSPPAGVSYTGSVVGESDLPKTVPGKLVSCAIKVAATTGTDLGAGALVCWPVLPTQSGFAYYFDGSKWVKTTSQTSDGQVCANVVPGSAPNPVFVAVFDK